MIHEFRATCQGTKIPWSFCSTSLIIAACSRWRVSSTDISECPRTSFLVCVHNHIVSFVASARLRYQTPTSFPEKALGTRLTPRADSRWSRRDASSPNAFPQERFALYCSRAWLRLPNPAHRLPDPVPPCPLRIKRTWCFYCSTSPPDVPSPWDSCWYEQHIISSLLFLTVACPLIRQH